ncbi:MAG: hypothetical protein ACR2IS_20440 [Nitrososphaeraceae archaeon]
MDLTTNIHQITSFRPYNNEDQIRLTEDESITVDGIADINIKGAIIWECKHIDINF